MSVHGCTGSHSDNWHSEISAFPGRRSGSPSDEYSFQWHESTASLAANPDRRSIPPDYFLSGTATAD
ncbi:MAG: hypothetical protein GF353_04985 [Candidatus Lokiarchaeota archaeon]|nr:hypothetical protein [Candidatus Lokiarchaeota archaeon]